MRPRDAAGTCSMSFDSMLLNLVTFVYITLLHYILYIILHVQKSGNLARFRS
ncbi:hypothetical protein RchiOBHm_Chr6g0275501 [Rosa chinensis]|uniref:Uncharacterized protein n=1 Tax=Rosa chinensis TaxID=74649 RepID=A0A2P6PS03_ROSCH|nr:hypothetical protein RchiOBHm_Chr6g0275501 [Rosa chinensis]